MNKTKYFEIFLLDKRANKNISLEKFKNYLHLQRV